MAEPISRVLGVTRWVNFKPSERDLILNALEVCEREGLSYCGRDTHKLQGAEWMKEMDARKILFDAMLEQLNGWAEIDEA